MDQVVTHRKRFSITVPVAETHRKLRRGDMHAQVRFSVWVHFMLTINFHNMVFCETGTQMQPYLHIE